LLEDSDADEYMQHKPEAERKLNPAVPGAMKVPSSSYTPNEYDCLGCKERDKKIKELLENKQSLCSSHGSSHPESYMKVRIVWCDTYTLRSVDWGCVQTLAMSGTC
jgi:hypothetical protein